MGAADSGRERGNQEETVEAAMSVKGEEAEEVNKFNRGEGIGWDGSRRRDLGTKFGGYDLGGGDRWTGGRGEGTLDGRKRRRDAGREEDLWGSAALPGEVSATEEKRDSSQYGGGGSVLTKC